MQKKITDRSMELTDIGIGPKLSTTNPISRFEFNIRARKLGDKKVSERALAKIKIDASLMRLTCFREKGVRPFAISEKI